MGERIKKMNRVSQHLAQAAGEQQSTAEIAEALGVEAGDVEEMLQIANQTVSLDTPREAEESRPLIQLAVYPAASTPFDDMAHDQLAQTAETALQQVLTRREEAIIRLRYGLAGHAELTLAEIGEKYSLSRERVRQIEVTALKKLRKHNMLKEFITGFNHGSDGCHARSPQPAHYSH
jgi:RNA polymerase primary sigma factor